MIWIDCTKHGVDNLVWCIVLLLTVSIQSSVHCVCIHYTWYHWPNLSFTCCEDVVAPIQWTVWWKEWLIKIVFSAWNFNIKINYMKLLCYRNNLSVVGYFKILLAYWTKVSCEKSLLAITYIFSAQIWQCYIVGIDTVLAIKYSKVNSSSSCLHMCNARFRKILRKYFVPIAFFFLPLLRRI